jgi:hypothetical protein
MAYGQIHYSQKLGTGPSVDSIADVGCFLTAFSNLLERFGEGVDPPTLNNFFIQHGTYMADGANRDYLGWGSVSAYDGNITATKIGGAGWPQTNNAIVKFIYKSSRTGQQVTHFCLVADWTQRVILDSWDGQTKVSPYGNPVAWASYDRHVPQIVVAPPPPSTANLFTVENIPTTVKALRINTHLWDLTRRTWPDIANNPVRSEGVGFQFETSRVAHHMLGGSYYMPNDGNGSQGYNIVDCKDPEAAPAPPPAPEVPPAPPAPKTYTENTVAGIKYTAFEGQPKPMYINKVGGTEKWSFENVSNWRQFKSVGHFDYGQQVFIVGSALHPIPPNGAMYYMVDADFGDFRQRGTVVNMCGFNKVDLSETRPPALPAPAPVAAPEPAPVPVPAPVAPADWRASYKPFSRPLHYIATCDQTVSDINNLAGPNLPLPKYNAGSGSKLGMVAAYGTVFKDGIEYYRLKTEADVNFDLWYCVPKVDPVTRTANLLVAPGETMAPISKATVAKDAAVLAKSHIEINAIKFLDDIIPKWFQKTKNKTK